MMRHILDTAWVFLAEMGSLISIVLFLATLLLWVELWPYITTTHGSF